jgi:hypothetical protein
VIHVDQNQVKPAQTDSQKKDIPKPVQTGSKLPRMFFVLVLLAILGLAGLLLLNYRGTQEVFATKQSKFVPPEQATWRFIVSGDSRNCGDIVMPAIAAHSTKNYQPSFYWHLGDLRAIYMVDEDMAFAEREPNGKKLACSDYLKQAWPDFVKNQIYPFGKTPFYLGLGNHEVIPPKGYPQGSPQTMQPEVNSAQFTSYFADWLLPPGLKAQRVKDHDCDNPSPAPCVISARNYYHWIQGGVDFIYLDNASNVMGQRQLDWFKGRLEKAKKDASVRTIIVGMHEALPDSISSEHAMCDPDLVKRYKENYPYKQSCNDGREAYRALLDFQNQEPEKHVFVLASHSHYFMDGIFKTDKTPVPDRLHGWIVGTAGAVRYGLPPDSYLSNFAETDIYGYLVGTVDANGNVDFQFQHLAEGDIPPDVRKRYQPTFVNWCFAHNKLVQKDDKIEPSNPLPTNNNCATTTAVAPGVSPEK